MLSQIPKRSDIRNLLVVLFSGVAVACVLVGVLVYFYNPTGRYWAHKVLLSPETLTTMVVSEPQRGGTMPQRYLFEGVDFIYYNKKTSKWVTAKVVPDVYQQFWDMVEGDWSVVSPEEAVMASFKHPQVAHLSIKVKPDPATGPVKAFQEVYFIPDSDLYRVELKGTTDVSGEWAYFRHPAIYEKVLALFTINP